MTKAAKQMKVSYRDKRGKKRSVRITSPMNKGPIDFASEGAALADQLYDNAPGGTVDHMMLRLLGKTAAEPSTSEKYRSLLRELQTEIVRR